MKARLAVASFILVIALGSVLAISSAGAQTRPSAPTETYNVDPVHSAIIFRIKHFGVSYFYGRINNAAGTIRFNAEDPGACSFEISAIIVRPTRWPMFQRAPWIRVYPQLSVSGKTG